jgi:hypothetical protein
MKKAISLLIIILMTITLMAQTPSVQLSEMKKLNFLVGKWKGEGWIEFGPGQRRTFTETETVESRVGGLVLVIEGLGKNKEGAVIHDAFAVATYDKEAKVFRWQAYRAADGSYMNTEAQVTENTLIWGFHDARAGELRFTIKLNEKGQWFEIGEISLDGKTWYKFFEMTLNREA